MKVEMSMCDGKKCNRIDKKLNHIIIENKNGLTNEFDLCDECLNKMMQFIETDRHISDIAKRETETGIDTAVEEAIETYVAETKSYEIENNIPNRKGLVSKTCCRALIEEYGLDKLKEEYINKNRSSSNIADEIGISKRALDKYLHDNSIKKRPRSREKSSTPDSKDSVK